MLDKIFSALTIVRHAVAITVVTGAAGAMVAGSADLSGTQHTAVVTNSTTTATTATTTHGELEALVKACLESKDAESAACADALSASGLTTGEFWSKLALSLNEQLVKHNAETPKPETHETKTTVPTRELLGLVTACVESNERASAACQKALELSGVTADEFWARVGAMFHKKSDEPKTEPTTKPNTESLTALVKDCLAKYEAAKNSTTGAEDASRACRAAIEASGLSSNDFWARFGPKTTTTGNAEPTRKPEPARTPEPTRKTEPTRTPSVSTAQLEVLVKDCFAKYLVAKNTGEGGAAAAEACNKAIAASGLSSSAFFAKFGTPGSN